MLWNVFAVFVGLVVGMAWNMALITLNSKALYPMPAGVDVKDKAAFQAYVDTLPTAAFLVVMAAHLGQAFFGGLTAAWLGGSHPVALAMVVGGVSMVGGIMMLRAVRGPAWMVVELPLYLVLSYAAGAVVAAAQTVR